MECWYSAKIVFTWKITLGKQAVVSNLYSEVNNELIAWVK